MLERGVEFAVAHIQRQGRHVAGGQLGVGAGLVAPAFKAFHGKVILSGRQ